MICRRHLSVSGACSKVLCLSRKCLGLHAILCMQAELVPTARELGIGFLAYSPLVGLLFKRDISNSYASSRLLMSIAGNASETICSSIDYLLEPGCTFGYELAGPLQGRGFLTGAIKKFEDIPEQQRIFNPRMSKENFHKVI